MKKKIILIVAMVLAVGILAGAGTFVYSKFWGKIAYNEKVQSKFINADEELTERLHYDTYYKYLRDREITYAKFLQPEEESVKFQVFYSGIRRIEDSSSDRQGCAVYDVPIDYYKQLTWAKENGDALSCLETLFYTFRLMNLIDDYYTEKYSCNLFEYTEKTEENIRKFNEIFNVSDVGNNDIVKQIGFLPYDFTMVEYSYDYETHKHYYTYRISGISYCQTKSVNRDAVKENENLIIESDYDINHVKAYNRDILFTSTLVNPDGMDAEHRVAGDFSMIIDGINSPYTMQTVFFQEIDLFKAFGALKGWN